jgi:hypothetical protein
MPPHYHPAMAEAGEVPGEAEGGMFLHAALDASTRIGPAMNLISLTVWL